MTNPYGATEPTHDQSTGIATVQVLIINLSHLIIILKSLAASVYYLN